MIVRFGVLAACCVCFTLHTREKVELGKRLSGRGAVLIGGNQWPTQTPHKPIAPRVCDAQLQHCA